NAAGLFVRKLYYVFHAQFIALPHSYPFYAYDERTLLRFLCVGPWLLIPLGLVGLIIGAHGGRSGYLAWAAFVPAYGVAVAIFFIAERYRLPLLVALCVTSGGAIQETLVAIRARRASRLAIPATGF